MIRRGREMGMERGQGKKEGEHLKGEEGEGSEEGGWRGGKG